MQLSSSTGGFWVMPLGTFTVCLLKMPLFFLLRSSFDAPEISHLLRCSQCFDHSTWWLFCEKALNLSSLLNLTTSSGCKPLYPSNKAILIWRKFGHLFHLPIWLQLPPPLPFSGIDSHLGDCWWSTFREDRDTLPSCVDLMPTKRVTWDGPLIINRSAESIDKPTDCAQLTAVSSPHSRPLI